MRANVGELLSEVRGEAKHRSLGTADWMTAPEAKTQLALNLDKPSSAVWLGENLDPEATPVGYDDDRHVLLVSGTRGGKGTGVIVPNLCLWPGSAIIIDPKGENATVTARRRGAGSDFAHGMGQKMCVLDPFSEVDLGDLPKARFNPLDAIDPAGDFAIDDAGRIAAAMVPRENKQDPFWEDAARTVIKGLILHVLSNPRFANKRHLGTVRTLLTEGDKVGLAMVQEARALKRAKKAAAGEPAEEQQPEKPITALTLLWQTMKGNQAFDGAVASVGESMLAMHERTRTSVLENARNNTEFIHSRPMRRVLETSDFDLAELKTNPKGLTVYLVLPQRYMETHYRWLRLMVTLAVGEMERVKGRPQTGHRTLFLLDEFAGLKRMPVIEHAVAQAAGFGVKFMFVLQDLPQLKKEYEDGWETFIGNSGTRIFFQIDENFTRDYLSKLLGEQEVRRETRSVSEGKTTSQSTTAGENNSVGQGSSESHAENESIGRTYADWELQGRNRGLNRGDTTGTNKSDSTGTSFSQTGSASASTTEGHSEGVHRRPLLHPDEIGRFLSRIDNRKHPAFPGLMVCLLPGRQPLIVRRVNYFQADAFAGLFDGHIEYPPPPTLLERTKLKLSGAPPAREASKPKPPDKPAEVKPQPPKVMQPIPAVAEIMRQIVLDAGQAHVFPEPPPPPQPAPVTITAPQPVRRFSVGDSILPLLIFGTAAVAVIIWLLPHLGSISSPSAPKAGVSAAYNIGYAARQGWETWVNKLSGASRDGAMFWAGERSKRVPGSCQDGTGQYSDAYRNSCLEAQRYLNPIDQRRLREPDYRAGWNSY